MAKPSVEFSTEIVVDLTEKTPKQLLHVDDEASFLKTVKPCLEMQGAFQVDTALHVEEAIEKMKKKTYDAIVCDYVMPNKDGLQFLKELRESGNNIPFIIFTGKGREEVAIEALNLGADRYFSKIGSPETVYGELAHGINQAVERRRAEERIKESEEELRCIFDAAIDGIAYVDTSGKILAANQRLVEEMLGYKLEDTLGKSFPELGRIEPKELPGVLNAMAEVIATGKPVKNLEVTLVRKDGRRVPTEISTGVVEREHKVTGIIVVVRDITERKKVEEALRQAEEKFRTLLDTANVLIQSVNAHGKFIYVNAEWKNMLGYTDKDLRKITLWDVVRKDHRAYCMDVFKQVMQGKSVHDVEAVFVAKDGKEVIVRGNARPILEDGKFVSTIGLFLDITERKKAENATRDSQEKFERMFIGNPEASVYVDSAFHIVDVNPRFETLFGYSPEETRGKRLLDLIVPESKKNEGRMLDKKARKGYVYHDTVRKRKDGSLVQVSISAAPVIVKGQHLEYVAVYKDISQLKSTEKALRESLEKLRVVGRLTRHDVRNKLSAVTSNVYLAKHKLADNHEALEYLKDVESAVRQTERIFDFARIYERLGMEELVDMNVTKSLEEAVKLVSDLHAIEVVDDCRGLTVLADSLLRQLFYNFIDNSLKYGEKVSQIRVHYEETGKDRLKLVYEDDGNGIHSADKEKIFKEGYGKGTGYGLYLIRKMCEVYGWTIRETGKHGKGAQFTITIPKTDKNGKLSYQLA